MGWATVFVGHAMAGDCLLLGFVLIAIAAERATTPRQQMVAGSIAGLLLGWSVVVEFTGASAALIIAIYGLFMLRGHKPASAARLAGSALAAGLIAMLPLAIYNLGVHRASTIAPNREAARLAARNRPNA